MTGTSGRPSASLVRSLAVGTLLLVAAVGVFLLLVSRRARSPAAVDLSSDPAQRHDQAYKRAIALIDPHMKLHGRISRVDERAATDLREGVRYLDIVVGIKPDNWAAWWVRGKAEQALGEHEAAYASFGRAYAINDQNLDVGRELVSECLETGRASEAVRISETLSAKAPKDAGLLANLALAYLVNGQLDEATRAADASLQLDPADVISARLKARIDDVRSGRRAQPKTLGELQR
jgi:tetratricopeptide (TPR) repeat protein